MGNLLAPILKPVVDAWSGWNASHVVHVLTGDRRGAGTDANVWLVLRGESGEATPSVKLDHWLLDDNERGSTSTFYVHDFGHVERVVELELRRDRFGVGDAWFVDRIEVENKRTGARNYFPIQRWIKSHVPYVMREYDCCLPADSHHAANRSEELREKRMLYEYKQNVPGGPAQIKDLPDDEKFGGGYLLDLINNKLFLYLEQLYLQFTRTNFKTIEDVKNLYRDAWIALERQPYSLESWQEDWWFGLQRVQSCNAILIQLCKSIPDKFGVTEEMLKPSLEGLTLAEALEKNRLFLIDLKILDKLECKDNRRICSPLALFFLNKSKNLLPVAIQLFQEKSPKNPVFLPTDPPLTWLLAKMYYNNADAIFHQAYTHLGFTHLIMEGVVICTHRNLSPSHPLFRLLAPHFLYLLAINTRGLDKLVSVDGWVDKTMTCGRTGMFNLIQRGLNLWRLDQNGNIPQEIANRGVADPEILPHYPYRDDATAIYNAIHDYVSAVVRQFYTSDESVLQDHELQDWRRELILDREKGGVGMLGVPGDDDGFTTVDQVVETMTSVISVCSIGHAAANFQQYDEYAFTPNYPAFLSGEVPTDKTPLTEEEIVSRLPDKSQTLDIMVITKLLSNKGTQSLGDFEVQYLYHPIGVKAAQEFRETLKHISNGISIRNATSRRPYTWLDPEIIPNAISI